MRLSRSDQLTFEPSTVVVAEFLETCEVGCAKNIYNAHIPGVPETVVRQFYDGTVSGLCWAFQYMGSM